MANGVQLYSSDGKLQMSVTSRMPRIIGNYTVSVSGGGVVDVSVPGVQNNGEWIVFHNSTNIGVRVTIELNNIKVRSFFNSISVSFTVLKA